MFTTHSANTATTLAPVSPHGSVSWTWSPSLVRREGRTWTDWKARPVPPPFQTAALSLGDRVSWRRCPIALHCVNCLNATKCGVGFEQSKQPSGPLG